MRGKTVRALGQTLGQSQAHVLGMLCYSWWPYNLLHISSVHRQRRNHRLVIRKDLTGIPISSFICQSKLFHSAHLTRKKGILFKLR